ncbi:MAG: restriction endonuclease subunit S [Proteobacteria bacterium]|nr:restriction endonuclease subunit S [Pseudomonadota bacterium]
MRLDRIFREVKNLVPLDGIELLTPSVVRGVVPQSSLDSRPQQADREGYQVAPAQPDDFVISLSSHSHGIEWCGLTGGISPDYTLLRPVVDRAYCRYLKYALKSQYIISQLGVFKTGVRMGLRLTWNKVRYCQIDLPSLPEATRLADYLDRETARIDALIAKKTRFIELLAEKRQALITHAVTKGLNPNVPVKDSGVDWLGRIPSTWQVKRLRFICDVTTGGRDTVDAIPDGEYPFFVRSQEIAAIDSYSADCEAVLTAGDGAGVGKVYHYINGKFDFHQRVYMMSSFRSVCGKFFFYYLQSLFAAVALDGGAKSTVDSLRMPVFKNFPITIPGRVEEGAIIAFIESRAAQLDALIAKTECSIELLREHRTALITAAVTGKIDLRDAA